MSWWVPDEATMHQGEAIEMTDETLAFDAGAPYGGVRISLRATGANAAVGESRIRATGTGSVDSAVPIQATR